MRPRGARLWRLGLWLATTLGLSLLLALPGPAAADSDLERRMQHWQQLSPQERQRIRERNERLEQLSPEQRDKLRRNYQRWQRLAPEQRQRLRQRFERYQELSPEQRKQLRERSKQRKQQRQKDSGKGKSHKR